MAVAQIADGLHMIPLRAVNAYLVEAAEGLVLIDAGFPKKAGIVLDAIRALGKAPEDLRHIVLTHAHVDHIGSLAALVNATGAQTWMHAADAPIAERGSGFRPMRAAPGLLRGILFRLFVRPNQTIEAAKIDHLMQDGEVVPIAGGLRIVAAPGHCLGQVAVLWPERGVLFAGDAVANLVGIGDPLGYEDQLEGRRSQKKLAGLDFNIACFGHGKPLVGDAAHMFRKRFA